MTDEETNDIQTEPYCNECKGNHYIIKNNKPGKQYDFFLHILCHSYDVIKKQIKIKKIKKKLPFIIKKRAIGISTNELKILLINSLLIIFYQNFFLYFCIL